MTSSLDTIIYYLEKEEIKIDKSEFEFQVQSHPDFPSILSIVDALSFFNIDNVVIKKEFSDINDLPSRFISLLSEDRSQPELYLTEKKDDAYFYFKNNKLLEIVTTELESRWNGIVLLVGKSDFETSVISKSKKDWVLFSLVSMAIFIKLVESKDFLFLKLFLLLPFIGVLFSIAALKDLFGTKSKVLNDICNISASTSCSSVIKSNKWQLFEYLNFSDLSITFFTSQFIVLLFSLFFNEGIESLFFQKTLLYFSIPFLFLSIYYQKFVEKRWCPICLIIITIIVIEIITLLFFPIVSFRFLNQAAYFGLIYFSCYLAWKSLKQVLTEKKELKERHLKSIRFERNYDLFKTKLLTINKADIPTNGVVLGNKKAKTNIAIISNPFCGHCKEAHFMLNRILEKNEMLLNVTVILRTNLESVDDDSKKLFRGLLRLFYNKGEKYFVEALSDWFENTNIENWLEKYYNDDDFYKIDEILLHNFNWTNENEYTFTPAVFINGFGYPQIYDRKNLEFFINEIIEDEDLN